MTSELPSFKERLAKIQAEKGITPETYKKTDKVERPNLVPVNEENADLIPQVYDVSDEQARSERAIEQTLNQIKANPLKAYAKFIGKTIGGSAGGDEIYISCPLPDHRDEHPSAWINTVSGAWYCGGCQVGGDVMDLGSIGFGRGPKAKNVVGAEFHRLKEDMASSFGLNMVRKPGERAVVWFPEEPTPSQAPVQAAPPPQVASRSVQAPAPAAPASTDATTTVPSETPVQQDPEGEVTGTPGMNAADYFNIQATQAETNPVEAPEPSIGTVTQLGVVPIDYKDDAPADVIVYPTLDWKAICAPDTFLYEYMVATSRDDSPEEYHFWHAMLALGHTVGKNVQINDGPPVNANLMLCLLGGTGFGKSKSRRYLDTLLREVVPFKAEPDRTVGVKALTIPGSGEHLIGQFEYHQRDPITGKPNGQFAPVNGIVDWDEFSGMISKSKNIGSTLQQTIMKFADCHPEITTGSKTNGDQLAFEPFCSITASTQPRALRAILSKNDQVNGFLNRWVFAGGPRKEREVFGGDHSEVKVDMARAKDELLKIKGWGGNTKRLLMIDDAAMPTIYSFFKTKIEPMMDKDDTEMLQRLNLIYKKVMLLIAINQKKTKIDLEVHERAMPIVDYLVYCYGLVSASIGVTAQHELADDVMHYAEKHLAKTGRGATSSELSRYLRGKNPAPGALKQTIDFLVALDMLEVEDPQPGRGRPAKRFRKVAS